jgi:hypothetical protein
VCGILSVLIVPLIPIALAAGIGGNETIAVDVVTDRFGVPLTGLRIVCDCANGAMSGVAPVAFARLGADVTAVGDQPSVHVEHAADGVHRLTLLVGDRGRECEERPVGEARRVEQQPAHDLQR